MAIDEKVSLAKFAEQLTWCAGLDLGDRRERVAASGLLHDAEDVLADCVGLKRSITDGPSRGDRIKRLRVLRQACQDLVSAIEGLDEWTWIDLEGELDGTACPLPDGDGPRSPLAVSELERAASRIDATLGAARRDARDEGAAYRNQAIAELAAVFHAYAAPSSNEEYRGSLVGTMKAPGFIPIALKAAGFPVPQPLRKTWSHVPKSLRTHRGR